MCFLLSKKFSCCCIFPLRGGAILLSIMIVVYSVAGAIFLLKQGMFFFFVYPEWLIYGGLALAIATSAILSVLALITRSALFVRTVKYLWPFLIVFSILRGIVMILELLRGQDNFNWECNNGGQLWQSDGSSSAGILPGEFCSVGFKSVWAAFLIALLVDLMFQFYIAILIRRFSEQLEHLERVKSNIWRMV